MDLKHDTFSYFPNVMVIRRLSYTPLIMTYILSLRNPSLRKILFAAGEVARVTWKRSLCVPRNAFFRRCLSLAGEKM